MMIDIFDEDECPREIHYTEDDDGHEYAYEEIGPVKDFIKITIKDTVEVDEQGNWDLGDSNYPWSDVPKEDYCSYTPGAYWHSYKYDLPIRDDWDVVDDVFDLIYKNDPLKPGKYEVEAEAILVYNIDEMTAYLEDDGSIARIEPEYANITLDLNKSTFKLKSVEKVDEHDDSN